MPDDRLAVPAPGAADPTATAARGDATGDPDGGGRDPYAWEADLYDVTTTGVSEQDVPFYTALAAVATVRAHLGPGGRFAGDVFVPDPEVLTSRNDHHGFAGEVRHPDTGQRMALWEHNSF